MKKRLSRRDFLRLSTGAAAGGILAACGGGEPEKEIIRETVIETVMVEGTPQVVEVTKEVVKEVLVTAPPPEQVQLRLAEGSWVGPEGIKFWTEEVIPRFELENPDIKVTFEDAESPDYQDKLYTQAVAGDMPDVFFIWWSEGLMEKNQLLPLDDYFDDAFMADFYPGNVVGQVYEGHLYGVPKYISSVVMAYNKDILDEAGIAYPDGTWDWYDYLDAYKATTNPDKDQWGCLVARDYINHYVWMNGGEWMNADLFGDKCLLGEDKALEALKFLHDLVWGADRVAPNEAETGEFGWWNIFSTGKVAFMESHSWTVTNYIRENDFRWDFIDLPVSPNGGKAGLTFTNGYSIGQSTKYPEQAARLLTFLVSPWAQKQTCVGIIGSQPARRSMTEVWDTQSMGARAGYDVAAFSRTMEQARLYPVFKDGAAISEIWAPIWDQIWLTGDLGLEEGIDLIVQRIDDHYKG